MIEINEDNHEKMNLQSDKLVLLKFGNKLCTTKTCIEFKSFIEQISEEYKDSLDVFSADISNNFTLMKTFGVRSKTTALIFRNGVKIFISTSFDEKIKKDIKSILDSI